MLIKNNYDVKAISRLLTCSTEFELLSKYDISIVEDNLLHYYGRFATSYYMDNGNGFNHDIHSDCSVRNGWEHPFDKENPCYLNKNRNYHSIEISTSPITEVSYANMVKNLTEKIGKLKHATGDFYPTPYGSNHIHMAIVNNGQRSIFNTFDNRRLIKYIAIMLKGFFPIFRILGAFTPQTIVRKTSYEYTINDYLMRYWNTDSYKYTGSRDSMFRVIEDEDFFHVEFRGSDSCQSPELLALQMITYKALILYCVNCMRYDTVPYVTKDLYNVSWCLTKKIHDNELGERELKLLQQVGEELIGRLAPFFKVMDSPEVTNILRRFLEKPAYLILREKEPDAWQDVVEYLISKKRPRNEELREKAIKAIVSGVIPKADSLTQFKKNLAQTIDVPERQVNSLYVMMCREGYNMEFTEGRLHII